MNIGKASKLSDLTVKATRYYANIDLVKPIQDFQTGYRNYTEKDVLKLKFIGKARSFNFSIDECRELLSLYENENRPSKEVKKITLDFQEACNANLMNKKLGLNLKLKRVKLINLGFYRNRQQVKSKGKMRPYTSATGYMFLLLNKAGEIGFRL